MCVHANGFTELHLTALGAMLARRRLVVWFHGSDADKWDRRLGPLWRVLPGTRVLAAVSPVAAQVVVDTGTAKPDEITIIPNPIDPQDCLSC